MKNTLTFLFLGLVITLCAPKQESSLVEDQEDSPAKRNSSLPYLIKGADENLYLSWVKQSGDTAILKYAYRQDDGWSKSEEIARGTNWFVKWADYPMISVGKDGGMIAHYLAKR